MTGRLDGKVAIVTGGASGIGRATVLRFLAEGAAVTAGDLNDANGEQLMRDVAAAGFAERAQFVRVDVAEEDQVEALVARTVDKFGRLDCIFNNAGVGGAVGPVAETAVSDWDYTFEVLVRGVFLGIKHAVRQMAAQGEGGSIVNTASIAGLTANSGPTAYSAAKASVINLTKSAAVELAAQRIRVNAIAPGLILTPIVFGGDPDRIPPHMRAKQPWPDAGQPADIAATALFLASDDAKFVSGETITVDGALTAAGPNLWGTGADNVFLRTSGVNRGNTGQGSDVRRLDRD